MKSLGLILYFIASCFVLTAGNKDFNPDTTRHKFRYQLGITPSALLNVFSGIQLSHKLRLTNRFRFDLETAYLFDRLGDMDEAFNGFRLRPSIGFRFFEDPNEGMDINFFYNYRWYRYYGDREFVRANGAYKEILQIERNTLLKGPGFTLNYSLYDGNYSFAFGGGLGLGVLENDYDPGFQINNGWFNGIGKTEYLLFFIHFNVGFLKL